MRNITLIGALLIGACVDAPTARPLIGVEFLCEETVEHAGRVACEFIRGEDAELKVWLPDAEPEVWIDGEPHSSTARHAVDGGWRLTLAIPPGASEVVLRRSAPASAQWQISIAWREDEFGSGALAAAFNANRWQECSEQARIELATAVQSGRALRALNVVRTGVICSAELGTRDFSNWLAAIEDIPVGEDIRALRRDEALLDTLAYQGFHYGVSDILDRALPRSVRLGNTISHAQMLMMRSDMLAQLGDIQGALVAANQALDPLSHPHVSPCDRAAFRINTAWALLQAGERTHELSWLALAEDMLFISLGSAEEHSCSPAAAAMSLLNLARIALLRGSPHVADYWLDAASSFTTPDGHRESGELTLLRARTQILLGDVSAARGAMAAARTLVSSHTDLEAELRITEAEMAEAMGDGPRAIELYLGEHRRTLDRLGGVGHEQGAQRVMYDHISATQRLVHLLLRDDPAAAFKLAREAAASGARLLAARISQARSNSVRKKMQDRYGALRDTCDRFLIDQWDLPKSERSALCTETLRSARLIERQALGDDMRVELASASLRKPATDEVLLSYFPGSGGRLLGFAATASEVHTAEIDGGALPTSAKGDAASLDRYSELLLEPFAHVIDGARRIRVLPSFGHQEPPFHAFPWRGAPLLVHAEVEYSLDLPVVDDLIDSPSGGALIIGDPQGDLEGARDEALYVAAALRVRGLAVHPLIGRDAVGLQLRAMLPEVDHLHYAGHSDHGGDFGWDGSLRLSQGTSLSIPDILTLGRAPRTASLLSCESGVVDEDPRNQGVGLATAFLLAGSQVVLATATRLPADEAPAIAEALYASKCEATSFELRTAYRAAMTGPLRQRLMPETWQALRLWVP